MQPQLPGARREGCATRAACRCARRGAGRGPGRLLGDAADALAPPQLGPDLVRPDARVHPDHQQVVEHVGAFERSSPARWPCAASITHSTASSPSFCATLAVPRASSRAECEFSTSPAARRFSMVCHSRSSTSASASAVPRLPAGAARRASASRTDFGALAPLATAARRRRGGAWSASSSACAAWAWRPWPCSSGLRLAAAAATAPAAPACPAAASAALASAIAHGAVVEHARRQQPGGAGRAPSTKCCSLADAARGDDRHPRRVPHRAQSAPCRSPTWCRRGPWR